MRQIDIEPDRLRADIAGAAIGRLHDAGPAAGHDHDSAADRLVATGSDETAKLARDFVITAVDRNLPGNLEAALQVGILRAGGSGRGELRYGAMRDGGLGDAGTAEHDDRVRDVVLGEQCLRLQIVEHQAHAAHIGALQEIGIAVGPAIARAGEDCLHGCRGLCIFGGRFRLLRRQRFLPQHSHQTVQCLVWQYRELSPTSFGTAVRRCGGLSCPAR